MWQEENGFAGNVYGGRAVKALKALSLGVGVTGLRLSACHDSVCLLVFA